MSFGRGPGRPSRKEILDLLDASVQDLRERFGGLPRPEEAAGIWRDIWVHEAHNSTAIEGNTLVLREVETLLQRGRAVGSKELKDYLEVQGYAAAAQWVYSQALAPGHEPRGDLVTVTEVRQVHQLAMTPVWGVAPHPDAGPAEGPGSFRLHDIHPFGGGMTPPAHPLVPARLRDWLDALAAVGTGTGAHTISQLAQAHAAFERVHPFLDGNGRTGRLVLNLALVRLGYPPAIVQKRDRTRYLRALDKADNQQPGALTELMARSVLDNLHRFIVPGLAGPHRLVALEALTREGVTAIGLRNAASRGRLQAVKGSDGRWRSSVVWVDAYLATKHQRRRSLERG